MSDHDAQSAVDCWQDSPLHYPAAQIRAHVGLVSHAAGTNSQSTAGRPVSSTHPAGILEAHASSLDRGP